MVDLTKTFSISIGETKVNFVFRRSIELGQSFDLSISLLSSKVSIRSNPTIISRDDVIGLSEYIEKSMGQDPETGFVTWNLGFEFLVYDNDDYVTTIDLFLLVAEPQDTRRSYLGCRGPVLSEELLRFASQLRDYASRS
ncbi:hypothetical protein SH449x_004430 [Pirellulaceae bacterium SH449]